MFHSLLSQCTVEGGQTFPSFPNEWWRHSPFLPFSHSWDTVASQCDRTVFVSRDLLWIVICRWKVLHFRIRNLDKNLWNVPRLVWDAVQGWLNLTEGVQPPSHQPSLCTVLHPVQTGSPPHLRVGWWNCPPSSPSFRTSERKRGGELELMFTCPSSRCRLKLRKQIFKYVTHPF